MADRIDITGIEVYAHHGVFEHEQAVGQTFLIDLSLDVDLASPGLTDRLEETVDYGVIVQAVHDVATRERWNLIERLAQRVAETVLENPLVAAVTVAVHKPDAPIPVPFRDVAVTLMRSR